MNAYVFTDDKGTNWKRVNKKVARRVFDSGETIVLCACNMRPFGPWRTECPVNNKSTYREDFDYVVNSFEYYNCSHPGEGRYASFYIQA